AATGTEFRVWEPGTWRPVRQIPGGRPAAFAPDGKVLAVAASLTSIRLFATATWRPLARLEGPDADLIDEKGVAFTPDGTRLLVSYAGGSIRIWDLRRIRARLAEAGLDLDLPAYPPAPPRGDVKPVRVEVLSPEPHFKLAKDLRARGDLPGAVAALRKAQAMMPDEPELNNWLAWLLAICPDPTVRDPRQAVELAGRA